MRQIIGFIFSLFLFANAWGQALPFPGPGAASAGGFVPIGTPTSFGTASTNACSGTTATLTTTAPISSGNLLVIHIATDNGNGVTVQSISDGTNSYSKAVAIATSANIDDEIWYKGNASAISTSATLTVTWTGTVGGSCFLALQTAQVTGITSSPLDQNPAGQTGSGLSVTVTTGTLAKANEIAFGISTKWNGSGTDIYSGALGFTNLGGTVSAGGVGTAILDYDVVSSTTAINYIPTWVASGAMAGAVATFKGN